MERPRLLIVPMLTELEWPIRHELEEWADVASYDAPGIGDEPSTGETGSEAAARRGLEEVDRRGWDRFIVAADEFGVLAASHLAAAAGDRVQAVVLGHARISNSAGGPRAALNNEVLLGVQSLLRTDPRTFVRQLFKMTGGEAAQGGYEATLVDEWLRRVPMEVAEPFYESRESEGETLKSNLEQLRAPMLLAQHRGCILFTEEGFEDAVAMFPDAEVHRCDEKPSTSLDFVTVLREFCERHAAVEA